MSAVLPLRDVIESAMNGGAAEADDLICVVWPRAYRIAFSIVRNHTLAEDVAQEACAILFRSIGRLRSIEAFGVWFYRIVVRQAVAAEKRNAQPAWEPQFNSHEDLDVALTRIDVVNALATLTPAQRVVIALNYYAEMNSREIADVLGIADSSVRFQAMRAKRALQKALAEQDDVKSRREVPYGAA